MQRVLSVSLTACFMPVLLAAEQATSPHDEAVAQLSAAYAKLEGFIATYHSEGKNKTLDVTVAMDEGSGLAVTHMVGTKGGKRSELRQWSTPEGRVFTASGGDLFGVDVYAVAFRFLREFEDFVDVGDEQAFLHPAIIPSIILEKTTVGTVLGLGRWNSPTWTKWVEGAQLKESNNESVTFSTGDYGDLTISRETGLLVKQSMSGGDGEARVLELKDLRLNPGQGEVAKISAGWKTEGAKPMEGEMATLARRQFLTAMVDAVDEGGCKLVDLEKFLKEKREALESVVDACVVETEGSLAAHPMWDAMLDQDNLKKLVKAANEKGVKIKDVQDAADLEAQFADKDTRVKIRDGFVSGFLHVDGLANKALGEIFGVENGVRLPAKTADGKAAAELLETALARAYFTIVLDRRMLKLWGPPKDG